MEKMPTTANRGGSIRHQVSPCNRSIFFRRSDSSIHVQESIPCEQRLAKRFDGPPRGRLRLFLQQCLPVRHFLGAEPFGEVVKKRPAARALLVGEFSGEQQSIDEREFRVFSRRLSL